MILHAVDRVDLYGYETDDVAELGKALKRFMERPELAHVNAIKNGKVYGSTVISETTPAGA